MRRAKARRDDERAVPVPVKPSEPRAGGSFLLACAVLGLVVAVLYWPSLSLAPIALDDQSQLRELAQAPLSRVWAYDRFGHLRPLKSFAFWSIAHDPALLRIWRVGILGVLLLTVGLVQQLAARALGSRAWGFAAATCWVLNPTLPAVVCWLSATSSVFCLFGVLLFIAAADRASNSARGARALHVIVALAGLLLALLSHELALVAPVLWLAARRMRVGSERRPLPVPIVLGAGACIALWLALHALGDKPASAYRFETSSPWLRSFSAARYFLENVRLWAWLPGRFGVLLADRPNAHVIASAVGWLVVLGGLLVVWRLARAGHRVLAFGAFWCAALLAPMINLVPIGNTPVAVHYLYLPGVGLAVLLARAGQRLHQRLRVRSARAGWLPVAVLAALVLAWLPEQRRVLAAFGDEQRLYATTVRNYPHELEPRVNLVSVYLERKQYADAGALLSESLALAPNDVGLIRNQFEWHWSTGDVPGALALQDAHAILRDTPDYLTRRGKLLEQLGRHDEAVEAFRHAFERAIDPRDRFAAGYFYATALVRTLRGREAARLIEQLLVEFPGREELLIAQRLLANQ
jgi:tetratricopeptide (TPR) repeat protein